MVSHNAEMICRDASNHRLISVTDMIPDCSYHRNDGPALIMSAAYRTR